ncbi:MULTISPECIES: acyl-CoA dehydrogenase family protein [Caulobacter]|uniref:Acyl-CoA dehydrogenase n=1 Tax=Caulobacter endophyticus TaxID=2172652 RepID=A0A2T9KA35_9CAUL|nr:MULTISPECIES: acyl-CoA/acyl-ACP dehydrogenase [Caulobacter]PVM92733.1 acyl-CoA dehydrogenase [Caulobacter endophyticus]
MAQIAFTPAPAPPSVAAVLAALRHALQDIRARAADLDAGGEFPAEDVALLASIGALEVMAGDATSPRELMEALRLVGRANLSLGRIFEGHVNGARLVAWYGSAEQRRTLEADLAAGKVLGVWNTEPTPGVTIADGRLHGAKSYATGAGHIDIAVITAATASGGKQMVLADAADPARADPSAWRVRGMRATVSGTYDLTGLPVDAATRLGAPGDYEREPRFSAGAWRFTAVQLGGVEHVLTLLREHLAASPAGQDPIHRARFGKALAATRSAYLWVREAAQRAEAPDAGAEAISFVLMTRGVVEEAGLTVMEAAARSVGTRAFFVDNPLDQACRDLALYLRQPVPDQALDRAAAAFLAKDAWADDPLW